jgi:hypothetical protein
MKTIILNVQGNHADRKLLNCLLELLFPECRMFAVSEEEAAVQMRNLVGRGVEAGSSASGSQGAC